MFKDYFLDPSHIDESTNLLDFSFIFKNLKDRDKATDKLIELEGDKKGDWDIQGKDVHVYDPGTLVAFKKILKELKIKAKML